MAEVPHPLRLLQHIGWVVAGKVESVLLRFERRVREEYRRTGPRDN